MRIFQSFLFLLMLLIYGCGQNPTTGKAAAEEEENENSTAAIEQLQQKLDSLDTPSQLFSIPVDKKTTVVGRNGTKISVDPANLETENGKPLGKDITVELKELLDQQQLAKAGAQTSSNGRLLISGGAYLIKATSDGMPLRLKKDGIISVVFPQITSRPMTLFYGHQDTTGQINWLPAGRLFREQTPTSSAPVAAQLNTSGSELDAVFDYISTTDTIPPPMREDLANETSLPITKDVPRPITKQQKLNKKIYEAMDISELGWINCDAFYERTDTTTVRFAFNQTDSVTNANVYLIFSNINSALINSYAARKNSKWNDVFTSVPVGEKVKLLAITVKKEKMLAYSSTFTIARDQQVKINLREINDDDLYRLFSTAK